MELTGRDQDEPDPAWAGSGFTAEQAHEFRRWRFSLGQAVAWRQAGVPDGLRAAQWVTAGVTPDSVGQWRAAGIDAGQAVHWHEIGFSLAAATEAIGKGLTPDTAFRAQAGALLRGAHPGRSVAAAFAAGIRGDIIRRFLDAGVPHHVMREYLAGNWDAQEALPWARAGVPATDAVLWRGIGLTPAEAGRLARKGASAVETIREWWRAGIPFDEAADWIGAGLTAKEAADQRARGITAEQAAALRALRDQDEDG
jgi:hypothetical protein